MTGEGVSGSPEPGNTHQAVSSIFPAMRFSWEIKSVDAVFCNGGSYGIPRINDLTKEAMLQAITDQDLRFLAVIQFRIIRYWSTGLGRDTHGDLYRYILCLKG